MSKKFALYGSSDLESRVLRREQPQVGVGLYVSTRQGGQTPFYEGKGLCHVVLKDPAVDALLKGVGVPTRRATTSVEPPLITIIDYNLIALLRVYESERLSGVQPFVFIGVNQGFCTKGTGLGLCQDVNLMASLACLRFGARPSHTCTGTNYASTPSAPASVLPRASHRKTLGNSVHNWHGRRGLPVAAVRPM